MMCEGTKGVRRKVWTRTKILSPNIRYFDAILRFVAIYALCIAYYTELNLKICNCVQKRRICREKYKYALDDANTNDFLQNRRQTWKETKIVLGCVLWKLVVLEGNVVGFPNWHVTGCLFQEKVGWGTWLGKRAFFRSLECKKNLFHDQMRRLRIFQQKDMTLCDDLVWSGREI